MVVSGLPGLVTGGSGECSAGRINNTVDAHAASNVDISTSGAVVTFMTNSTAVAAANNANGGSSSTSNTSNNSNNSNAASTSATSFQYTGSEVKPTVVITMTDQPANANGSNNQSRNNTSGNTAANSNVVPTSAYTVTYSNNINAGTANVTITAVAGSGYTTNGRSKTATFTISPANISSAKVTCSAAVYKNGTTTHPDSVTVNYNGSYLTQGTDYTLSWPAGSYEIGKDAYTVTVTGTGNYTGTATGTYSISYSTDDIIFSEIIPQTYTGEGLTPELHVFDGDYELIEGTDYNREDANNTDPSFAAQINITYDGNYYGSTAQVTYKIIPPRIAKSAYKVTKKSSGKVKVSWTSPEGGAMGYKIRYSTNAKFKSSKTVKVKGRTTAVKIIKGLTTGKTYYFKIRTYFTTGTGTLYSKWSKVRSVKV